MFGPFGHSNKEDKIMFGHHVKRALEKKKEASVSNKYCRFCPRKAKVAYLIGDKILLCCSLHEDSISYYDRKVNV